MTASYSEISFDSQSSPLSSGLCSLIDSPDLNEGIQVPINYDKANVTVSRPDCLNLKCSQEKSVIFPKSIRCLQSEGTIMKDGDLVMFVTEDLENKIKLSSPVTRKNENLTCLEARNSNVYLSKQAMTLQLLALDNNVLNELENEARKVATSVDSLTENLSAILHSASALTVGCLETYKDAVCKSCDAVDYNIKSMYQLMAKCEELSKSMNIIYEKSDKIKDMRKVLDAFENTLY